MTDGVGVSVADPNRRSESLRNRERGKMTFGTRSEPGHAVDIAKLSQKATGQFRNGG